MKIPLWVAFLLTVLAAIAGFLANLLRRPPGGPTPADVIVIDAEAEKKKIADAIKADSDAALAEKFNKLGGGKT